MPDYDMGDGGHVFRHLLSRGVPIEVFDKIYYRYADPNYSINEMPLIGVDCRLLKQAVEMLDNDGKATVNEMRDVLTLVRERLTALLNYG